MRSIKRFFSSVLAGIAALCLLTVVNIVPAQAGSKFRGVTLDAGANGTDIDRLVEWNVNLVYYFLDPNAQGIATNEADYLDKLEAELTVLDDRLAQYGARGIQVAINLYGSPGDFVTRKAPAQQRVFAEAWAQSTMISAWQKIATRYAGNPAVWGYNLLNEPAEGRVAAGLLPWKDLSVKIIDAIRAIDPSVRLIIQPPYGNPDRLNKLRVIKNRGLITYSFNAYTPYAYTHQGLYNIKLAKKKYPNRGVNKARLQLALAKGFRFGKKNKVPLFVAEFTAVRWAPGAGKYLADMASVLEKNKVDWTYHAYYGGKVDVGNGNGKFTYPWSLVHTNDLNSSELSPTETDRLKALKRFFRKNK